MEQEDTAEPRGSDAEPSPFNVGDHVTDREGAEDKPMVVVGIPGNIAREHTAGNKTIAEYNEEYPETDDVIEVAFAQRTDTNLLTSKQYAYPASRLELRNNIHSSEEETTASELGDFQQ